MPHHPSAATSLLLTDLSILVESLGWLRSINRRQQSQPWHPIKCGPSMEPVTAHLKRFHGQWTAAIARIIQQCPTAAAPCRTLLQIDPLRPDSEVAITDAIAAIRHLIDQRTVRWMVREKVRSSFAGNLRRLRVERGLCLRGLAGACELAARLPTAGGV